MPRINHNTTDSQVTPSPPPHKTITALPLTHSLSHLSLSLASGPDDPRQVGPIAVWRRSRVLRSSPPATTLLRTAGKGTFVCGQVTQHSHTLRTPHRRHFARTGHRLVSPHYRTLTITSVTHSLAKERGITKTYLSLSSPRISHSNKYEQEQQTQVAARPPAQKGEQGSEEYKRKRNPQKSQRAKKKNSIEEVYPRPLLKTD